MVTTLILSSICLTSFTSAYPSTEAAKESQDGQKHKQKRTCRIIFPERPNDSPKFAYLFDGKRSQRIELPSMNLSPVISLSEGEITLYMTDKHITDTKKIVASTPSLKIPANVEDFYILVSPDSENSTLAVKMEMISLKDHKPGETLWLNKTQHHIAANLGLSEMSVAPESQTVSKAPIEKSGYYKAEFTYQPNGEGEFKKITEQQWWHDAKSRHLGFVVDSGKKLPKIFIFRDFRAK